MAAEEVQAATGHWTYDAPDKTELRQGDILDRTPAVLEILKNVHPYFANHEKYLHFMLITQSCDLARRGDKPCKAPYLTIAAVRQLTGDILEKELPLVAQGGAIGKYVRGSQAYKLKQFVERLLNNNEPNYFFLRADQAQGLGADCCACLRVTVPLRSEHYEKLLDAKRGQLSEVFQAKLGWLVGTNYSRVGTQDWDDDEGRRKEFKRMCKEFLGDFQFVESRRFDKIADLIESAGLERTDAAFKSLEADPRAAIPTRKQLIHSALATLWPETLELPERMRIRGELLRTESLSQLQDAVESAVSEVDSDDLEQLRALLRERLPGALASLVDEAIARAWPGTELQRRTTFMAQLNNHADFIKAIKEEPSATSPS